MADYYPAQAKVFLERTDSNDNKGYYKLLACKIRYQILGVYILRRDSDIEDAIQIFTKENNEPMLARALYYKGAMTFNTTHDTTQTLQILKQACRHSSIMRQKEKLDLYDLMCRITHDNSYTVKLEEEARQSHNFRIMERFTKILSDKMSVSLVIASSADVNGSCAARIIPQEL